MRFGHDVGAATLTFRTLALWLLGYPATALAEINHAIKAARETGHTPTLLFALGCSTFTHISSRDHAAAANAQLDECVALAEEKGSLFFKAMATGLRGCVLAVSG